MRFIYDGEYREFRGYVFAWRKPVTVSDKAAIEACLKDPAFKVYEEPKEQDPEACPKCGKVVKQGRFLHVKHCKG